MSFDRLFLLFFHLFEKVWFCFESLVVGDESVSRIYDRRIDIVSTLLLSVSGKLGSMQESRWSLEFGVCLVKKVRERNTKVQRNAKRARERWPLRYRHRMNLVGLRTRWVEWVTLPLIYTCIYKSLLKLCTKGKEMEKMR